VILAVRDEETYSARLAETASTALRTTTLLVVCERFLNFIAENLKNIYSTMLQEL
jgi:hypothetical protein